MSVSRASIVSGTNSGAAPRRLRQPLFEAPSFGGDAGISESLFDSNSGDKGAAKNFKVVVRVRPKLDREAGLSSCLQLQSNQVIAISKPSADESEEAKTHTFPFDRIYDESTPQLALYESCVKPVVLSILEGYNGSIIAYGQTGTGKTFTIEGGSEEARGIIPRTSEDIFGYIENSSTGDSKFLVRASFLQIYNEHIMDLLAADKKPKKDHLHIREDASGVYVDGLSEHIVKNPGEIMALLHLGSTMRTTASTNMNRESSRSHAVFTIIVERSEKHSQDAEATVTIGKLNLVDLAGSERIRSTGVSTGARLDETKNINKSLSAFGKVILALTSPGNHHVPYRDSKLTRILQGSLGGNCRTTMITAITSAMDSYMETLNSLKFAKRAKNVKNFAIVNQDLSEQALLTAYEREITRLRKELEENRRQNLPPPPTPALDQEMLDKLRQQHAALAAEKDQIQTELEQRGQEIAQAQEEKKKLMSKLGALERQLLTGGTKVQDHPEFHAAVAEAEDRLKREYENRFEALERERTRLAAEKEQFELEKSMFTRRRSELSMSMIPDDTASLQSRGTLFSQASSSSLLTDLRETSSLSTMSVAAPTQSHPPAPQHQAPPPQSQAPGLTPSMAAAAAASPSGPRSPRFRRPAAQTSSSQLASSPAQNSLIRIAASPPASQSPSVASHDDDPPPLVTRASVSDLSYSAQPQRNAWSDRMETVSATLQTQEEEDVSAALEDYMQALRDPESGIATHDRRVDHQFVRGVFSGLDAVDWFMNNMQGVADLPTAQAVGQKFIALGLLTPVNCGLVFEPTEGALYRLPEFDSRSMSRVLSQPATLTPGQQQQLLQQYQQPRPPSAVRPASTSLQRPPSAAMPGSPTPMARRTSALSLAPSDASGALANAGSMLQRYASPTPNGEMEDTGALEEEYGATLLHSASGQGDRNAMKTFLQTFPVDCPDRLGRTPLMYASIGNRVKAVEMLLRQGAVAGMQDSNGRTSLLWAAYYGHFDILRALVKHDRSLVELADPDGRTCLHWSTKHETTKCLDLLLKVTGPDVVNAQDNEHVTALHWAVLCQHAEHTLHLLKAGADVTVVDTEGRTALHYAVSNDNARCLRVLLEHAEEVVNYKDARGRAALHLAISAESPLEIVTALLGSLSCDVNCTDARMTTPLHWAAVCNRPDICKALCQRGAVLSFRDTNGMTPLHYAIQKGYTECAAVLQKMAALLSKKNSFSSDPRPMAAVART
eukprot:m.124605 g.124605  ORF g.124605 m.124605 type:complete len:1235 (-) comp9354_c0_seq1:147-3851(-)